MFIIISTNVLVEMRTSRKTIAVEANIETQAFINGSDLFSSGVVKSKRSIWRLKTITDFFWAIVNFIGVFFNTMFSVTLSLSLHTYDDDFLLLLLKKFIFLSCIVFRWKSLKLTEKDLALARNGMEVQEVLEVDHTVEAVVAAHVIKDLIMFEELITVSQFICLLFFAFKLLTVSCILSVISFCDNQVPCLHVAPAAAKRMYDACGAFP